MLAQHQGFLSLPLCPAVSRLRVGKTFRGDTGGTTHLSPRDILYRVTLCSAMQTVVEEEERRGLTSLVVIVHGLAGP